MFTIANYFQKNNAFSIDVFVLLRKNIEYVLRKENIKNKISNNLAIYQTFAKLMHRCLFTCRKS